MSLVPYLLRVMRNAGGRDLMLIEDSFSRMAKDPFFQDSMKLMKSLASSFEMDSGYSNSGVKVDGKKMEVHLDVQNFTPEQIKVKTIGNEIMVEGKKEIKKEDGWTRSIFERKFLLPEGFPPERVECHLDKGKLVLVAFRAEPIEEREIPIKEKSSEEKSK